MDTHNSYSYDCQVGDRVYVRPVMFLGSNQSATEAVVLECHDQWIKVQCTSDGLVDMVHRTRVFLNEANPL